MGSVRKTIAAAAGSFALLGSPAFASPEAQAQSVAASNADAWLMLSTLSGTRSVALAGANASAQPADVPPPPPLVSAGAMADGAGEVIPFVLMFGLIAVALTISGPSGQPNSPA